MSFFANIFIGMIIICIFIVLITILCRILFFIILILDKIFKSDCCFNILDIIYIIIEYIGNLVSKYCCICRRNEQISPVKINYNDAHIIVINPCNKYQIATVSKVVNN